MTPTDIERGAFNELEKLTAAVAKSAGIDATEKTYRMLRAEVRRMIATHFENKGATQ